MTQQQYRLELQNTVQKYLDGIRVQNNVSAAAMEDAINHYLVSLKDLVLAEFIAAASQETLSENTDKGEEKESGTE